MPDVPHITLTLSELLSRCVSEDEKLAVARAVQGAMVVRGDRAAAVSIAAFIRDGGCLHTANTATAQTDGDSLSAHGEHAEHGQMSRPNWFRISDEHDEHAEHG